MNTDRIIAETKATIENGRALLEERESESERPDFVVINGLKWDRENTGIEGREHFNWYEALGVAQANGKRLPTEKELDALTDRIGTWNGDRKGRWLGNDHKLKSGSKESIFLPATGFQYDSSGELCGQGYYDRYWSACKSSDSDTYACSLHLSSMTTYMNFADRSNGLSVRLVSIL
jgi:uncharacterized protein (TIGR02145 family)